MTVPPLPTVIVIALDADSGAPRKTAKQYAVSIQLAQWPWSPSLHTHPPPSLGPVLTRGSQWQTNRMPLDVAKLVSTSIAATTEPLSP
jgi:hypothetical protein